MTTGHGPEDLERLGVRMDQVFQDDLHRGVARDVAPAHLLGLGEEVTDIGDLVVGR
ncbi:MAG: hypothetical protein J0I34_30285 [Pseudonocardia sp.]|uniref:hypothetical protein n=1 Tax=Actinomycetes TaxID=1760 RepID=UPI001AD49E47|nr:MULTISPECIES: hypothetical protein [Actinomycetes]MBN9113060.1 hypothetical protein [Pseudonocardia sp.]